VARRNVSALSLITHSFEVIKNNKAQHLAVPQYEGLSSKDILRFIQEHMVMEKYLPETREITKLPK
jgi:hypothetical protein